MATKAEQETVIRWDRDDTRVHVWTADPAQARRLTKAGYDVAAVVGTRDGTPTGWRALGPAGCVRFRKLRDGQVVRRRREGQNPPVQRRVDATP